MKWEQNQISGSLLRYNKNAFYDNNKDENHTHILLFDAQANDNNKEND